MKRSKEVQDMIDAGVRPRMAEQMAGGLCPRYEYHEAANTFPLIEGEAFESLVADIKLRGLTDPIVLLDGKILDGRNRYRACLEAGVAPQFVQYTRAEHPWDYVWSTNAERRHLPPGQRGACYLVHEASKAKHDASVAAARAEGETARRASIAAAQLGNQNAARKTDRVSRDTLSVSERLTPEQKAAFTTQAMSLGVRPLVAAAAAEAFSRGRPDTRVDGSPKQRERVLLAKAAGISEATAGRILAVREYRPDLLQAVAKEASVEVAKRALGDAVREVKREQLLAKLEDTSALEAKAAEGVYDVIVIDPPWPMQKIERDERPNQSEFEYPTMTEAELAALEVPCADDCHVWVWTTHKFLPMAFRLLSIWELKYVCAFVWHKPGGFQPIGLPQYNCEFALYARRGAPSFIDTKAFPTCFEAQRGKHSEKPEAFYDIVRRVTAGRRLDMFNRRPIDGFDRWGNEAA